MFTITPLTEKEIDDLTLIPDGIYNFEVLSSERKPSSTGNPMASLQLTVWDDKGSKHIIKDYLIFKEVAFCVRKIKHFCEAVGLGGEYLAGSIRENFAGLSGKVHIGIQDETPKKDGTGMYPRKNIVIDYIVSAKDSNALPLAEKAGENSIIDDDLPF